MTPPRVLSYGGGLDSFALLVEALRRGERPDVVAFVDVADPAHDDPGEWPGTYRHIAEVVRPLCARERIPFEVIGADRYPVRDARSLFEWLRARRQIPVAGPQRLCTTIAKVERFEAWMGDRWPGAEVVVWLGFEAGEEGRAAKDPNAGRPGRGSARRRNRFPLIEWSLCRCRCEALVRAAGYPVPRKSACVFCPYATRGDFQALARELPETFARVVSWRPRSRRRRAAPSSRSRTSGPSATSMAPCASTARDPSPCSSRGPTGLGIALVRSAALPCARRR